jgi:hypothetical protein
MAALWGNRAQHSGVEKVKQNPVRSTWKTGMREKEWRRKE